MEDEAHRATGGCLCGAVRYEAEVFPKKAYYCHCRMCQKSSGAPAPVGVLVKPGTLAFPKEEPKFYQSSPFGRCGFCRNCGSQIVWMSPGRPDWTNLTAGTLDHPEVVVPCEHICVESQLPWHQLDDGLPRTRSDDDPELVAVWAETAETRD